MSYDFVKSLAHRAGVYRQARWVNRHVLNRGELHTFNLECALYRPFINPGDLCFDVGANFGFKTEVFLALGARVVSFEPQPDCCREIRARSPHTIVVEKAVGSAIGTARLYVDAHRTGSSLRQDWPNEAAGEMDVPVTTLDAAIAEFGTPRFCKIDVEGFENEVLKGLSRPIPTLTIEFTRARMAESLACLDRLESFGPIDVNFTSRDRPLLVSDQWLDADEARRFLNERAPTSPDFVWGDIFIRRPDVRLR